ncbi:Heavy metal-associated isoprenylated plant protein 22 [Bienertia sinuspersici]
MGALLYFANFCTVNRTRTKRKPFQTVEIKVKMDCDGCERRVKNAVTLSKGMWTQREYLKKVKDTVPYPYVAGAYDKRAPSGFVKDVPQAYHSQPSSIFPQQPFPNLFSDDNPNACSIM